MRILLVADAISKFAASEPYSTFKLAEALSHRVQVTLLCCSEDRSVGSSLADQLPKVRVVSWQTRGMSMVTKGFAAAVRTSYPAFYRRVRGWLNAAQNSGESFDLAHQLAPQAPRYPSPLVGCGVKYVLGPIGGSLQMPPGFSAATRGGLSLQPLRRLDRLRFKYDPWLRRSYSEASLVLGVAPYVRELLSDCSISRFEVLTEPGVDRVEQPFQAPQEKDFVLLHVGRGIRTKGLREVVRSLVFLRDIPNLRLVSVGEGPEIDVCRREAEKLGVADRLHFEGRVARERVQDLYRQASVFVFPTFREPAGNVLVEAMSFGLPVVTVAYGGPNYLVGEGEGIRLRINELAELPRDIAAAVRALHSSPEMRKSLGNAAISRVSREYLWTCKAESLVKLYSSLVSAK